MTDYHKSRLFDKILESRNDEEKTHAKAPLCANEGTSPLVILRV
ncbi:hypothetical protein [Helicobacter sp. T3_23-1059]